MMGTVAPEFAALALQAGYSSVIVDCEHGVPVDASIRSVVVAAQAAGGRCLVRLPRSSVAQAGVLSDMGVGGFVLAGVTDVEEMTELRRQVVIEGGSRRGLNPFVAAADPPGDPAALVRASQGIELWAMAETVELLDSLAATEGPLPWTGLLIGPYDLSQALGCAPAPDEPRLVEAVRRFAELAGRAGLRWSMFMRDTEVLALWRAVGVDPPAVVLGYDRDVWFQECRRRVEAVGP